MGTNFVGRRAEVETLTLLCAGAGRWRRPVVGIVHGEPGAGKTRLLSEVRQCLPPGQQVLLAGFEPEARVPLAVARDLLQRLLGALGDGSPLERILRSPSSSSESTEPLRLFEAAHRAVAEQGPLLIVVDDLQWVDETSLALLHYLTRAAESDGRPFSMLAAARTSYETQAFEQSLVRVITDPERLVSLRLDPLDLDAGLLLVNSLARDLDYAAAVEIWRRAGGSPFWIQTLVSGRSLAAEAGPLVSAGLRGAGTDATFVLAFLALAGRPVGLEDVVGPGDWSYARSREAADRLVQRGLAVETADGFRVAHDLVREAVARGVPPEMARAVHRRLALTWEGRADGDPRVLLQALDHRHAGGLPVVDVALMLARSPGRRLLASEGLHLLDAVAEQTDPKDPDALALREAVASLAGELGEHELALARWRAVGDLVELPERAVGGPGRVRVGDAPGPQSRGVGAARAGENADARGSRRPRRRRRAGGHARAVGRAPPRGGRRSRATRGATGPDAGGRVGWEHRPAAPGPAGVPARAALRHRVSAADRPTAGGPRTVR